MRPTLLALAAWLALAAPALAADGVSKPVVGLIGGALVGAMILGIVAMGFRKEDPPEEGRSVGRRPRPPEKKRPPPTWDDPSWAIYQDLLAQRGRDAADPPEQPDRRWHPADLQRLHPRFHPAYYEARVAAILPRIRHALATGDLDHAADCLAGPGRAELARGGVAIPDQAPAALVPVIVRDRQAADRDTLWLDLVGHGAVWHLAWQPQGWVLASVKAGADRDAALADRNVDAPPAPEGSAVERA